MKGDASPDALDSMDDIENDMEEPTEIDPEILEWHEALGDGRVAEALQILQKGSVDLDGRGPDGDTALHLACLYGHETIVKELLARNVDVNALDEDNSAPIHNASASGYDAIVEMLLAKKANVQPRDSDGETPLHLAANGDHPKVVRILLSAGADKTIQNNDGDTPLDLSRDEEVISCFQ
jgi:ankyrin repeat protein